MKYKTMLAGIFLVGLLSCENGDWEFADFDYTATYFPYQYPVRTLVLGDYHIDNENDNNRRFMISPRVAGMYENKKDWRITYEINESLVDDLYTDGGRPVLALPREYYSLEPAGEIIIPKGEFFAGIEVQLSEAFLNDPLATSFNYVIPLQLVSSTTDRILSGVPSADNADPRVAGDWTEVPKDFTLFGIKYVNEYHGKYLRRGQSVIRDAGGAEVETVVYRTAFVEQNEIWHLETTGRNEVVVSGVLRSSSGSPGTFEMALDFDEGGTCVIKQTDDSPFAVTGAGTFVKDGDSWGGKKRNAIFLQFEVNDGVNIHTLTDTLVYRDKAVVFEEFNPVVQ